MSLITVLGLVSFAVVATCQEFGTCEKYLVPYVSDEMLTESSFYCDNSPDEGCQSTGLTDGMSAKYARLNSTGYLTSNWAAKINDMNQYIQVNFGANRTITGVVLQSAGDSITQWVTAFKLQTSTDCNTFTTFTDDTGAEKTFNGTAGINEEVTRYLETRVTAQCVRIIPTEWVNNISLRFDITGFLPKICEV